MTVKFTMNENTVQQEILEGANFTVKLKYLLEEILEELNFEAPI